MQFEALRAAEDDAAQQEALRADAARAEHDRMVQVLAVRSSQ